MSVNPYLSLALAFSLGIAACESAEDPDDTPGGSTSDVASVAVDGFAVFVDFQSVQLFDPTTGTFSPFYFTKAAVTDAAQKVTISPDASRLAWLTDTGVLVGEPALLNGAPAINTLLEVPNADLGEFSPEWLRWSSDGERLLFSSGAIDPATGAVYLCDLINGGRPVEEVQPVPGTHAFVCGGGGQLLSDGVEITAEVSGGMTADGQFAGGTHVPTGAFRRSGGTSTPLTEDTRYILTGERARFPGFGDGVMLEVIPAGISFIYRREPFNDPPTDGSVIDPSAEFMALEQAPTPWRLMEALRGKLPDGDGRAGVFRGVSADGERVYYAVNSWTIEQGSGLDARPYQAPLHSALVEVARDGTSRAFDSTELEFALAGGVTDDERHTGPLGAVVSLDGDDLIIPQPSLGPSDASWVGWLDGAPWVGDALGALSPDGRWFIRTRMAEVDVPSAVCIRESTRSATSRCVPRENYTTYALGWVGYGVHPAYASDPPKVMRLSQSAAYDGAEVSVFGVRFGNSGTLTMGDTPVPSAAILSWDDRRIVFRMDADLPDRGEIVVTAATGSSAGGRQHWLHHTTRAETPFDSVPLGEITLGQGLNVVDIGDVDVTVARPNNEDIQMSPEARLDDGRYAIYSAGGPQPADERRSVEVVVGDYGRALSYRVEDRLADPNEWQLVRRLSPFSASFGSAFGHIVGALHYNGDHPAATDGNRVVLAHPASAIPNTISHNWGIPPFWRERPDGESAWVTIQRDNASAVLMLQVDWEDTWGIPIYADSPPSTLMAYATGVDQAGDVVVATGFDPMGTAGAAFAISSDGGASFAPHVTLGETLGTMRTTLVEPIRVDTVPDPFFLTFEVPDDDGGLIGVHAIELDGTFHPSVAQLPAGRLPRPNAPNLLRLQHAVNGGKVLVYFPLTSTVVYADFDASEPVEGYAWQTIPDDDAAGQVVSFYSEPGTSDVAVVLADGTVFGAQGDWAAWSPITFDIALALPTIVQPEAVSRLPDGRWLLAAKLFDGSPDAIEGAASPIAPRGVLVSPQP